MQIYVLCYFLMYFAPPQVISKLTYDKGLLRSETFNTFDTYPAKRKAPNFEQVYYVAPREVQADIEYVDNSEPQATRFHRRTQKTEKNEALQKTSDAQRPIYDNPMRKRSLRREDSYGIVYENGRPLGILEPYPQTYAFSPLRNQREGVEAARFYPAYRFDRELERNDEEPDATKINTKRDNTEYNSAARQTQGGKRDVGKRNTRQFDEVKVKELQTALDRMQNPGASDNVEEIEENLRGILDEMGLIEPEPIAKRSTEDENLEEDSNKIRMVKVTPDNSRDKREEKAARATQSSKAASQSKIEDSTVEDSKRSTSGLSVANYQEEGEAFARRKRHETNEVMKGLEKSGDLTLSGNKSPLASSGNEQEIQSSSTMAIDKDKREDTQELERNIQAKINAIKEQVKREIATLKAQSEDSASEDEDDLNTRQRKKRETGMTLLDEETDALHPEEHPEEKLIPHIRRRRNLDEADYPALEDKNPDEQKREISTPGAPSTELDASVKEAQSTESVKLEAKRDSHPQKTETEAEATRTRRQTNEFTRTKRSDLMPYMPYRTNYEEMEDDPGEFGDYNQYERSLALNKRESSDPDYSGLDTNANAQKYVSDMNEDVYANSPWGYSPNFLYHSDREKREGVSRLHGGGPMMQHLAAIRERNLQQLGDSERSRRMYARASNEGKDAGQNRPLSVADLSGTDLFGALSPNYNDELSRFKRVKRLNRVKRNR